MDLLDLLTETPVPKVSGAKILCGDARAVLRGMPSGAVQTIVLDTFRVPVLRVLQHWIGGESSAGSTCPRST
jgi:hypothetical protein